MPALPHRRPRCTVPPPAKQHRSTIWRQHGGQQQGRRRLTPVPACCVASRPGHQLQWFSAAARCCTGGGDRMATRIHESVTAGVACRLSCDCQHAASKNDRGSGRRAQIYEDYNTGIDYRPAYFSTSERGLRAGSSPAAYNASAQHVPLRLGACLFKAAMNS